MTPSPAQPALNGGELPPRLYRWFGLCFALLFLVAFCAFGRSTLAAFMVVISAGYTLIYFLVPRLMFRIEAKHRGRAPSPQASFSRRGLETWTGHMTAAEVYLQVLLIPAALAAAMTLVSLAWVFERS